MKDKKKTVITVVLVGIALAVAIYTCYHRWNEATCIKPKICTICGKTEGEALGHKWSDATCTEPQTCSVCHETKGKELGHDPDTWSHNKGSYMYCSRRKGNYL